MVEQSGLFPVVWTSVAPHLAHAVHQTEVWLSPRHTWPPPLTDAGACYGLKHDLGCPVISRARVSGCSF